jgi:protein gp37
MQESNIAWTDVTWNPTHGCSKVSAGCDNCYAERISRKYDHTDYPWTNEHAQENVTERPDKLEEPYGIEPSRIFVNSMSDLFHSAISEEFIRHVFAVMRNCPEHVFQVLTKRPGRAANMTLQWPDNVWMGTSVENSQVVERITMLAGTGTKTQFVSFEPLIGPVGEVDLTEIDWAIVGGESAPDSARREMNHSWARDILRQCRRDDVKFFFKQSSARQPEQGTALTVKDTTRDIYVQKEIREVPEYPLVTRRARDAKETTS